MRIIIVGAGVSGMLAASILKEKHDVTLIEKNSECGKKILATGNGKCNFWHTNLSKDFYETDNKEKLDNILFNQEDCLNYLFKIGIYPTIRDGYYYPNSKEASSIRDVLVNSIKGVNIVLEECVKSVNKNNDTFTVVTNKNEYICDRVIISSGSKSFVKECNTYEMLEKFGHTINHVEPALVKLKCDSKNLKDWDGVRVEAIINLLINDKKKKESRGELQLTKDGISGICIFDISGEANKAIYNKLDVKVAINFFPRSNFNDFMEKRSKFVEESLFNSLKTVFNKKLINIFLKESNIDGNKHYNELSNNEKERLYNTICNYKVNITGNNGFMNSQVCTGGVPLSEINEKTMESKIVPGLYITGEAIDVDGVCGGYNMSFAFITGYLAGDIND